MNPNDPNVLMLDAVAQRLGDALCKELVFVGGAVVGLLVTDPAQPAIRPTEDVDLLAQVVALRGYHDLGRTLEARGFSPDQRPGAPICPPNWPEPSPRCDKPLPPSSHNC